MSYNGFTKYATINRETTQYEDVRTVPNTDPNDKSVTVHWTYTDLFDENPTVFTDRIPSDVVDAAFALDGGEAGPIVQFTIDLFNESANNNFTKVLAVLFDRQMNEIGWLDDGELAHIPTVTEATARRRTHWIKTVEASIKRTVAGEKMSADEAAKLDQIVILSGAPLPPGIFSTITGLVDRL